MGRIILALISGTFFAVLGTGIGFAGGYLGGFFVSVHQSSAIEACAAIDAAANQKLITPAQAEKIGTVMVKEAAKDQNADQIKAWLEFDTPNAGEACKQLRKGINRA
ncbi:hypothetical protein [Leptolyngbya sp. NIES-2104]|uniref:hypothetical protein n=1 Tax=Leptolyngbya sp. NIES-2104 TaxID=1552121 RepID=UPI0006EC9847|nr:hypothetical protein [Leptolyngbya sp. NIES-2104]GAP94288.1 hypothetical protein NIES2104_07990 [Leptolyngbya sp. NIES-2104]